MRSKGTAKEQEARRRPAVQRVGDGWSQREVDAFLGVYPVTVAKWVARFRDQGAGGLAAKLTTGRPRFLTAGQEEKVLGWLADPPSKHGFRTDVWTARRVAGLIRAKFQVEFHPHYLREWLRKRNQIPQKPARRPRQQKKRSRLTAGSRKSGPASKKSRDRPRPPRPDRRVRAVPQPTRPPALGVAREDPVVCEGGGHRKKVSVIGAVSVSPAAGRLGLYFATLPDWYFTAEAVVRFLRYLRRQLLGKVVVGDGGPNHKGPVIRVFQRRN